MKNVHSRENDLSFLLSYSCGSFTEEIIFTEDCLHYLCYPTEGHYHALTQALPWLRVTSVRDDSPHSSPDPFSALHFSHFSPPNIPTCISRKRS